MTSVLISAPSPVSPSVSVAGAVDRRPARRRSAPETTSTWSPSFAPVFTARRSTRSSRPRTRSPSRRPSAPPPFGTSSRGRAAALAATGSGASLRNDTLTPMSGRIRGSSWSNPIRTLHRGLLPIRRRDRRDHVRRNPPVGIGVEHRLDRLAGRDAVDVALADVHLDLERRHVDDRADAGAGEAAAGRHRRDHLARLRVLRDGDAVERRAHDHVGEIGPARVDLRSRATSTCCCAIAIRALSDSTSASAESSSAREMTLSLTSCCRRPSVSSASRSRASSSAVAALRRVELRLGRRRASRAPANRRAARAPGPCRTALPSSTKTSRTLPVTFDDTVARRRAVT